MTTIGIAVPCYFDHYENIEALLENILASTVRPDEISISCSSWTDDKIHSFKRSGIPVRIWYSSKPMNAAQNRNRAASLLTTDLISFIDADDRMHPRRLEFLRDVFERRSDVFAVYHNYTHGSVDEQNGPFWEEDYVNPILAPLVKNPNAIGIMTQGVEYPIHHAHVTVRTGVWTLFPFGEDECDARNEDSIYGASLVARKIPCLFLNNKLSRYTFNK